MWWQETTLLQKLQIGIGLVGVVLVIAGVVVAVRGSDDSEQVEIITEGTDPATAGESTEIIVDVAGAVEKPGVYRLAVDARVGDALTAAGGLASEADRGWVARYLNLAQIVTDGAKIYIPRQNEEISNSQFSVFKNSGEIAGTAIIGPTQPGMINVNMASSSELDSLWGIGEKRAADIIANRPYQSIEELMTKAGIPKNVYERIKDKITIY